MDYILGIETGTDVCSVSLSGDGRTVEEKGSVAGNDHARRLAPLIEEILTENGLVAKNLSGVAVSSGPGSYTGLRIGVSTAKGLCYSLGIPLISIGSLNSLVNVALATAGELGEGTLLCPMIDARRMKVYAQVFDTGGNPLSEVGAHIIDKESFKEYIDRSARYLIFGNGADKCREVMADPKVEFTQVTPSASGLVAPAWEKYRHRLFEDTAYFEPLYLKDFIVTPSAKKLI